MSVPNNQLPIEPTLDTVKKSIAQYINMLSNQYQLPGILMIYILQEIIYESKLTAYQDGYQQLLISNGDAAKAEKKETPDTKK